MTTTPTKEPASEIKTEATTGAEPASARKSELAAQPGSADSDLESRVQQRRAELVSKLSEIRGEVGHDVAQATDRLKARLSELAHIIKEGVVDGWANLGDTVKQKLHRWLSESERSLFPQASPGKNGRSS